MAIVTKADIKKINELYQELKTYAAVARKTGFAPTTVKKYIIDGYGSIDESTFIRFDRELPELDEELFKIDDWGALCELSENEMKGVAELWKELEL